MPDRAFRALSALRRLRRIETDTARRDLGEAFAREQALSDREAAIARDMDAARRMDDSFDRDSFSAWFGRMSSERARVGKAAREAAARTEAARRALALRRRAETAAEEGLARHVAEHTASAARKEQATLEEIARAIRRRSQ